MTHWPHPQEQTTIIPEEVRFPMSHSRSLRPSDQTCSTTPILKMYVHNHKIFGTEITNEKHSKLVNG